MIRRLCIIGVGLIGGSLAGALRRRDDCPEIVGSSRREEHLQRAVALGEVAGAVGAEGHELNLGTLEAETLPSAGSEYPGVVANLALPVRRR